MQTKAITTGDGRQDAARDSRQGEARSGRQGEARLNDERVLAAAREVFIEFGADAPVSLIAKRAGVGMGTLYRRYPTKEDLIRRLCVGSMEQTVREAESALAEPEAWPAFVGFMERCLDAGVGSLSHLAGTYTVTDDVWALSERVRDSIQAVVDRAHRHGPLRPGVTAADVCLLLQRLRVPDVGWTTPVAALRRRYLALMLDGLRGTEPLPGPSVSWQEGADQWRTPPRPAGRAGR